MKARQERLIYNKLQSIKNNQRAFRLFSVLTLLSFLFLIFSITQYMHYIIYVLGFIALTVFLSAAYFQTEAITKKKREVDYLMKVFLIKNEEDEQANTCHKQVHR